nr:SDR family NAD(P)-dependent oxidoreductase [Nocardioides alcanivorans]
MTGRLHQKIAIVTGGAQGMGAATVRRFVEEGAKVLIADLLVDKGGALADELGENAAFLRHDVADEDSWTEALGCAEQAFGPVDVLVNNAGVMHWGAIDELDLERTRKLLDVNLIGVMLGAKAVVPSMKERGKGAIVNISSVDGLRGVNGLSAYTASKWAVRGFTKSLAFELGPHGIRVNSVHPGGVDTVLGNPMGRTGDELQLPYRGFRCNGSVSRRRLPTSRSSWPATRRATSPAPRSQQTAAGRQAPTTRAFPAPLKR